MQHIEEIINLINIKNFKDATNKIKLLSNELLNNAEINWLNEINLYEKKIESKIDKFKIFTNLGVIFFKLGKINSSKIAFKHSIDENPNFSLTYNNLAICYLELGKFEQAVENFVLALKVNKDDLDAQKHLINILNLILPKNENLHPIINLNYKINKLIKDLNIKNYFETKNIKIIISKSNSLINALGDKLFLNETQIFRKNSTNLNCSRHFKIFNKFNVIPKFCFSCYKVQINLFSIIDLIKLYFIFDKINFKSNNMRKCMVETRPAIKGNYKGYIYCAGLEEAKSIASEVDEQIKIAKILEYKINTKHGCSEFYNSYPEFEKISFNEEQIMKYNPEWLPKEQQIDKEIPTRKENDKKVWANYLKGFNLSDILIINNWLNYAYIIGDSSIFEIYDKNIKPNFLNKVLENQIDFRKNNF